MELTSLEEQRQLTLLKELRLRQHETLVKSGIARRVIDAGVPVNYYANQDDFTERTWLYPSRHKLANIAIGILWGGEASISGSAPRMPQDLGEWGRFIERHPDAHAIRLGRLDETGRGFSVATIYAGIQRSTPIPDGAIALDGIRDQDAVGIAELLKEVETIKASEGLTCLDDETLVNTVIPVSGFLPQL